MPYIDQEARNRLVAGGSPETVGELNYFVTVLLLDYLWRKGWSYTTYNEVVGVLECAKLEMYRRRVAPYEDTKCTINGDVFDGGPPHHAST